MNPIHRIRRLASILVGLAAALAAAVAAAPAAYAQVYPPPGPLSRSLPCSPTCANRHTVAPVHIHAAVMGGIAGWQITLIAVGTAIAAATVAVLLKRARAARRQLTTTPA